MKRIDITAQKFGRLMALSYAGNSKWECICDCGNTKKVHLQKLKSGWTKSCGCMQKEWARIHHLTHGMTLTSIYRTYQGMMRRCNDMDNPAYSRYGGRGIVVCDRWAESFERFYEDMGEKPDNMSLDRIDNDAGYSPENCRWVTRYQQNNNTRANTKYSHMGIETTQTSWARILGVSQSRLRYYAVAHSPVEAIERYMAIHSISKEDIKNKFEELTYKYENSK